MFNSNPVRVLIRIGQSLALVVTFFVIPMTYATPTETRTPLDFNCFHLLAPKGSNTNISTTLITDTFPRLKIEENGHGLDLIYDSEADEARRTNEWSVHDIRQIVSIAIKEAGLAKLTQEDLHYNEFDRIVLSKNVSAAQVASLAYHLRILAAETGDPEQARLSRQNPKNPVVNEELAERTRISGFRNEKEAKQALGFDKYIDFEFSKGTGVALLIKKTEKAEPAMTPLLALGGGYMVKFQHTEDFWADDGGYDSLLVFATERQARQFVAYHRFVEVQNGWPQPSWAKTGDSKK